LIALAGTAADKDYRTRVVITSLSADIEPNREADTTANDGFVQIPWHNVHNRIDNSPPIYKPNLQENHHAFSPHRVVTNCQWHGIASTSPVVLEPNT
jgi:hypothetical protein